MAAKKLLWLAAAAALLIAGAAGWRFAHRQPAHMADFAPASVFAPQAAQPVLAQAFDPLQVQFQQLAVQVLVGKYRVDPAMAAYLAQAAITVVAQDAKSFHLRFEHPDGFAIDQEARVEPEAHYTPTAAELQQDAREHRHTWNPKLSVVESTAGRSHVRLSYFVPYADMPDDLRQSLQPSTAAVWLEALLPTAHAEDGGSVGATMVSDTVVSGVQEGLAQGDAGKVSTPLARVVDVADALNKSAEHQNWMNELDALADCVQHPTNPLTQKAYAENPAYRDQLQQSVDDARSDVKQFTGMRYANLLTSVASDLVEGPLGVLTAPLSSYSEETLRNLSESRVNDVRKGITDCRDRQPLPGRFAPLKGEWKYDWRPAPVRTCTNAFGVESCVTHTDHREGKGTFSLEPSTAVIGVMGGTGSGTISETILSVSENPTGKDESRMDGDVSVSVEGAGSDDGGLITLTIHGEHLKKTISGSLNGIAKAPATIDNAEFGLVCRVEHVDMKNGGLYRAFVVSDLPFGTGTCEVTVVPQ